MISTKIKPEHRAGWEAAAARAGLTVEQFAQQQLDALGANFDRAEHERLFEAARQLPLEARVELKEKVLELAAANGVEV